MVTILSYKFWRYIIVSACILFIFAAQNYAQEVPIPAKHLINEFIERHITLGNLSQSDASVRPLTYTKVRYMLDKVALVNNELSIREQQLLQRFISEFSIDKFDNKPRFPLQKSIIKNIGNTAFGTYQLQGPEPHLLSYRDSQGQSGSIHNPSGTTPREPSFLR